MQLERFATELSTYGNVYSIVGSDVVRIEDRDQFRSDLMAWFSRDKFECMSFNGGQCIRVLHNLHNDYPELELEWSDEGVLLVCDLGPSLRPALPLLRTFVESRGWRLQLLRQHSSP